MLPAPRQKPPQISPIFKADAVRLPVSREKDGKLHLVAAIGAARVRAPADGYTLLIVGTTQTTNAALYDKLNFDLIRDIAPIAGVFRGALVIVVHPSVPARSVPEFIAYAKANPRNERTESNFPVQYTGANVPQAWAAGSVFMLTQALLGFLPDAPHNKLYVDPLLPTWLPDLTVRDLRIGRHKLDIRFWREENETAFEVTKGDPTVVERCDIAAKFAQFNRAGEAGRSRPASGGD